MNSPHLATIIVIAITTISLILQLLCLPPPRSLHWLLPLVDTWALGVLNIKFSSFPNKPLLSPLLPPPVKPFFTLQFLDLKKDLCVGALGREIRATSGPGGVISGFQGCDFDRRSQWLAGKWRRVWIEYNETFAKVSE